MTFVQVNGGVSRIVYVNKRWLCIRYSGKSDEMMKIMSDLQKMTAELQNFPNLFPKIKEVFTNFTITTFFLQH